MPISTRSGYPTKTAIRELLLKHDAVYRALDTYALYHCVYWGGVRNNGPMQLAANELIAEGFECSIELYVAGSMRTGHLKIGAKA